MRALARVATERDLRGRTRICVLRSGWPLMLRTTLPLEQGAVTAWATPDAARVYLAAGGAGPVGGDRLRLEICVGEGSALILGEVSPTLLLPGPHGEQSETAIDIHVGADATLAWLPQLVIAAHDCHHHTDIRVTLHATARLLLREEVLFGRHGEQPGALRQRLRVVRDDRPLYDQELAVGPTAPGWNGPAVTGGHAAAGALLVVEPTWSDGPPPATPYAAGAALLPLCGPAVLVSALAPDTKVLRRQLDAMLTLIVSDRRVDGGQPARRA
jgi:urease accessory protein